MALEDTMGGVFVEPTTGRVKALWAAYMISVENDEIYEQVYAPHGIAWPRRAPASRPSRH